MFKRKKRAIFRDNFFLKNLLNCSQSLHLESSIILLLNNDVNDEEDLISD